MKLVFNFMRLQTCSACDFGIIAYVCDLTCRSIYPQPYLQELSNFTLCIMKTLN